MTAPKFWDRPRTAPGFTSRALSPLGWIYGQATARRMARSAELRPPCPVICVGNLHAGGTGKTPTVMAVLQELSARGKRPFVISRGYGGSLEGPHLVRPEDLATQVGDEPLLLSAFAPVVIGKDRAAAAKLALDHGADILVMDDGFQNPSLAKDLSLVVVDAAKGFGNGRCLPAGPLREAVSPGLARADLLVSLGDGQAQSQLDQNWGPEIKDLPRLCASLEPLQMGYDWTGTRALAFAGIGRPEKFFATLRSLNVELVQTVALGDHQPINDTLFARLKREAADQGAQLVTTEKDATRLSPSARREILVLPVRLVSEDWTPLTQALDQLLP